MVNPDSSTFQSGEKIGLLIGKALRYALLATVVYLLSGLIKNIKPSHSPSSL